MFLKEPTHILLLLVVLVVLFGAKRLPDASRSLASSLKIFRSELKDVKEEIKVVDSESHAAEK